MTTWTMQQNWFLSSALFATPTPQPSTWRVRGAPLCKFTQNLSCMGCLSSRWAASGIHPKFTHVCKPRPLAKKKKNAPQTMRGYHQAGSDDWTILMKGGVKIIILYGIYWQILWSDLFEKQKMSWCYDVKIVMYCKAVKYTELTQDKVCCWALMTVLEAFITTRNFLTLWVVISCWKKALYCIVGWWGAH